MLCCVKLNSWRESNRRRRFCTTFLAFKSYYYWGLKLKKNDFLLWISNCKGNLSAIKKVCQIRLKAWKVFKSKYLLVSTNYFIHWKLKMWPENLICDLFYEWKNTQINFSYQYFCEKCIFLYVKRKQENLLVFFFIV